MNVLIIDNYDSFVFNLARLVEELGHVPTVQRNDQVDFSLMTSYQRIIISPGPCSPLQAGLSNRMIQEYGPLIPTLGVCLGHQCIGAVFGGEVTKAMMPMHGLNSLVYHDGLDLFEGLKNPLSVTRYHSLVVNPYTLPTCLKVIGISEDGEIMAIKHKAYPIWGVQFHPEALLTEQGEQLVGNFLKNALNFFRP